MKNNHERPLPLYVRILGPIARIGFIIAIPLFLIATTISMEVNNIALYEYDFDTYDIPAVTGIEKNELMKVARELIAYYNSPDEYIQTRVFKNGHEIEFYKEREFLHMKDVKGLIRFDYRVQQVSMLYIIAYIFARVFWRRLQFGFKLAGSFIAGSLVTAGLILFLGLWTLLGFEGLFLQFHLLSFSNFLWVLDPTSDYLLMMVPEAFFRDAFLFAGIAILVEAVALYGITILALKLYSRYVNTKSSTAE